MQTLRLALCAGVLAAGDRFGWSFRIIALVAIATGALWGLGGCGGGTSGGSSQATRPPSPSLARGTVVKFLSRSRDADRACPARWAANAQPDCRREVAN